MSLDDSFTRVSVVYGTREVGADFELKFFGSTLHTTGYDSSFSVPCGFGLWMPADETHKSRYLG